MTRFPLSKTRSDIMAGLSDVVQQLRDKAIQGEVWVDGSFVTEKIDPEDVDVVLRVWSDFVENCTSAQQQVLDWVVGNLKDSHHCDSYLLTEYPDNHPLYWYGHFEYAYWMRQWGFNRIDEMKGIAVISLVGGTS